MITNVPRHQQSPNPNKNSAAKTPEKASTQGSPIPLLDAAPVDEPAETKNLQPEEIAKTAKPSPAAPREQPRSIGDVPPFQGTAAWEPPPYGSSNSTTPAFGQDAKAQNTKQQEPVLDKPSLIYVRTSSPPAASSSASPSVTVGAGVTSRMLLAPGTRLRARLDSTVTSAVPGPVVAVIEYNYEQNGEIVVPAGSRAIGRLEAADRSGLVSVRFDSLILPDGEDLPMQALATDLSLRPLKGKVEGKNGGKDLLVRSVSGIGQVAATLLGRGSLNQPLSGGDLLRERVSSNIGTAADQDVSQLSITEHLVVTVPAEKEIYVVVQKRSTGVSTSISAASEVRSEVGANHQNLEELKQLLQLQRELNHQASPAQINQ